MEIVRNQMNDVRAGFFRKLLRKRSGMQRLLANIVESFSFERSGGKAWLHHLLAYNLCWCSVLEIYILRVV